MEKNSKVNALYVLQPPTKYTCDDCVFLKSRSDGAFICTFFVTRNNRVERFGSCNYWVKGIPGMVEGPYAKTKEESGYEENKEGFTCGLCEYFAHGRDRCLKVEEEIKETGCCNFWELAKK